MKDDGPERIIRIHIRVPYTGEMPQSVVNATEQIILAFQDEDYLKITELMTPNCRQQYPQQVLEQLRPVLINDQGDVEKDFYRLCANTVWYDAVKLYPKGNSFTFIEFILSSHGNTSEIVTLSGRRKMQ